MCPAGTRSAWLCPVLSLFALLLAACGREARVAQPPSAERSERAEPGPPPAELLEVLRLDGAGRRAEAWAVAERYLGEHPADGRGHVMAGMLHRSAGNYERAAAELGRALELSPDYFPARRYLAECRFLVGDLGGARREYAAWVEADPREPMGQLGLGVVALEEARTDEAEQHLRRALALFAELEARDPRRFQARRADRAECHARLADLHIARGELEAARDELLASTRIEPGHISAFHALSLVYRRLGEERAADEALARYERERARIAGKGPGEER